MPPAPWPQRRRVVRSVPAPPRRHPSPATSPPSSVSPYIAVPAVTTSVASASDMLSGTATSVDVVDGIFGESTISRESVGAMALVDVTVVQAVVEAGGVHALAAALALP